MHTSNSAPKVFFFEAGRWTLLTILSLMFCVAAHPAAAQTGGEAGIQGTVTDPDGAIVPKAQVTATNDATHVSVTRESTSDGLYTIAPVLPGVYTVTVKAEGFSEFVQKNLAVDALKLTGLNVKLATGSTSTEVTVTDAPPQLETTNATLGAVLENQTYENLPLLMGGQQRDPTAFATLVPGAQGGTRAPIIGGTGNYLAAVYIDGIPVTTVNQQGDNRIVSNALPVESIDQFQVVTSSPDAEYMGAGIINFTLRSGTADYHGTVLGLVRARAFDAWSAGAKSQTITTASGAVVPAQPKPDEHQFEFVASGGGPIPFTHKKSFFYVTYDKFHGRSGVNPSLLNVPSVAMRSGNFSELLQGPCTAATTGCIALQSNGIPCYVGAKNCAPTSGYTGYIFDPTTTAACTAANGGNPCRYAFPGNIIPQNYLSPIALKEQSFLPTPTAPGFVNNYFGGVASGFDNWEIAGRADYQLTERQRLSYVLAYGVRKNVPFTVGSNVSTSFPGVVLPLPYTNGGAATITPVVTDIEHAWAINDHMTNQLKYAFNRFGQPITALTDGVSGYQATDLGITNLPGGQASTEFPGASFGTTPTFPAAMAQWTSNGASGATQTTVPNTYTLLDNFLWTKGAHSLTMGLQMQWLEDNVASLLGYSGIYTVPYSANSTATFSGSTINTTGSGYSYASFLLGAAGSSGISIQAVAETGGRYHTIAPYVEDNWKVTPKLTVNLGLRWDYLPPFHEVQDRWSFLNPNLTNAVTGNKGELQFAGNYGGPGVSCGCRTPVKTYWKNYGPRVSVAYSITPTTVIRGGYALVYSVGGGVGGRAGAGTGTGALGFNVTATAPAEGVTGVTAGPSYYLNNSAYFTQIGLANTAFGGPGYTLPTPGLITAATQTLNTGNYVNSAGAFVTAGAVSYADPYLSGRAPEFDMWNFGIQQAMSNNLTLTLNYAGTESHFLLAGGSNARGYWSDQLDPKYLVALGGLADSSGKSPLLGAVATPANVAIAQSALSGYSLPYASISATNTKATIAQTLLAFPQYSGVSDVWGQNVANLSYNALQVSLAEREWHGLSFTVNYTWSKNMGDDGTFRAGYALPAGAVDRSTRSYKANAIDRSLTTTDLPHNVSAYGVWQLPGRHAENAWVRALAGGWQISSIYRFTSGTPFVVTYGGCSSPNAGTCEVSYNPNYSGTGKLNTSGGMRKLGVQYIDPNAFVAPTALFAATGANTLIGNVTRTAPYGLRNPYFWTADAGLRRTFKLYERLAFTAQVDCSNVANHPILGGLSSAWADPVKSASSAAAFGKATGYSSAAGPRDFQFAGRFTF